MYKKLISPETSPVLGPAITPRESPVMRPMDIPNAANHHTSDADNDANNSVNANSNSNPNQTPNNISNMEPFSLCNYCCSPRAKIKKDEPMHNDQYNDTQCIQAKPEFEFGHATHYKYNAITPRMICEFETGTPP